MFWHDVEISIRREHCTYATRRHLSLYTYSRILLGAMECHPIVLSENQTHNMITYYFCVVCNSMQTPLKYNSDFIKYSTLIGICTENSLKQEIIVYYIGINMITDVISKRIYLQLKHMSYGSVSIDCHLVWKKQYRYIQPFSLVLMQTDFKLCVTYLFW